MTKLLLLGAFTLSGCASLSFFDFKDFAGKRSPANESGWEACDAPAFEGAYQRLDENALLPTAVYLDQISGTDGQNYLVIQSMTTTQPFSNRGVAKMGTLNMEAAQTLVQANQGAFSFVCSPGKYRLSFSDFWPNSAHDNDYPSWQIQGDARKIQIRHGDQVSDFIRLAPMAAEPTSTSQQTQNESLEPAQTSAN